MFPCKHTTLVESHTSLRRIDTINQLFSYYNTYYFLVYEIATRLLEKNLVSQVPGIINCDIAYLYQVKIKFRFIISLLTVTEKKFDTITSANIILSYEAERHLLVATYIELSIIVKAQFYKRNVANQNSKGGSSQKQVL